MTESRVIPTAKDRIVARELVAGASQVDAVRAAGIGDANANRVVQSDGVREAFRLAMRTAGISDEQLAKKLAATLNATQTKRIVVDGAINTFVDPDFTEQRRSVELAARLLDLEPPQSKDTPVAVQVNVTFVGE